VNGVISLDTELPAQRLLEHLLAIEAGLGRVRTRRWEDRTIDLDILIFGGDRIDEAYLKVPHPLMHLRRFVLVPLVRLASESVHPTLGIRMVDLLEALPEDGQEVVPLEEEWK
jgi:2-amino-4-hydroxy-6-hydroxymethyldihydropteridine diphosphokinase